MCVCVCERVSVCVRVHSEQDHLTVVAETSWECVVVGRAQGLDNTSGPQRPG